MCHVERASDTHSVFDGYSKSDGFSGDDGTTGALHDMTRTNIGRPDSSGLDSDGDQVNDIRNINDINGTNRSFMEFTQTALTQATVLTRRCQRVDCPKSAQVSSPD